MRKGNMMNPQRVTLITLGVADQAAAKEFYARLGWAEHGAQDGVAFYQMNGLVLALFSTADLAADQGRPDAALGTGAITLAQNFATEAERRTRYSGADIPAIGPTLTGMSGRWQ